VAIFLTFSYVNTESSNYLLSLFFYLNNCNCLSCYFLIRLLHSCSMNLPRILLFIEAFDPAYFRSSKLSCFGFIWHFFASDITFNLLIFLKFWCLLNSEKLNYLLESIFLKRLVWFCKFCLFIKSIEFIWIVYIELKKDEYPVFKINFL
jgi:hypothetical protein